MAFAAITSLERMRDVGGFEQVFYASQGWYSRRIKDKATAVLSVISDDPTEPILKIIGGQSDYETKIIALNVENKSNAPSENINPGREISRGEKCQADTWVGSLVKVYPTTKKVFESHYGVGCFSCPGQAFETVEQTASMHNVDSQMILAEINKVIDNESTPS